MHFGFTNGPTMKTTLFSRMSPDRTNDFSEHAKITKTTNGSKKTTQHGPQAMSVQQRTPNHNATETVSRDDKSPVAARSPFRDAM